MSEKSKEKSSQEELEEIKAAKNTIGEKAYALDQEQKEQVYILPDQSISAAKFKPHPQHSHTYLAHPLTIRAMKKDIFILGEVFVTMVSCIGCQQKFEQEYWHLCPYCGKESA